MPCLRFHPALSVTAHSFLLATTIAFCNVIKRRQHVFKSHHARLVDSWIQLQFWCWYSLKTICFEGSRSNLDEQCFITIAAGVECHGIHFDSWSGKIWHYAINFWHTLSTIMSLLWLYLVYLRQRMVYFYTIHIINLRDSSLPEIHINDSPTNSACGMARCDINFYI